MSDDTILKKPAQDMTSTDTDEENNAEESAGPKIFDITADLNIAPAKDEAEENTTKINAAEVLESITKKPEVVDVKEPTPPAITPSFGPANPPAKTIGFNRPLVTGEIEKKAITLQEAIDTDKSPLFQKPKDIKISPDLKPIRTYEKDLAEAIAKKRISTASFVIAEDKKKNTDLEKKQEDAVENLLIKKEKHGTSSKKWLLSIISLILICGAIFSAYYLYSQSPLAPVKTMPTDNPVLVPDSIIKADNKSTIDIQNLNQKDIISSIKKDIELEQKEKTIKEIILTKIEGTSQTKITANDMLNILEIDVPSVFERSLGQNWMLGVYTGALGQKNPFVIATNDFFQNAFAGMIQWEKRLPEDLKPFLHSTTVVEDTGSSTPTISPASRGKFEDRLISNRDVREYITDNGHIVFLYSFIGNDKLVITNSEEALQEIIIRLENNTPVR